MSAKAVRWVPLDRDRCTLYEINKSMFMFMFMLVVGPKTGWVPSVTNSLVMVAMLVLLGTGAGADF